MSNNSNWPFDQAPNAAVFSLKRIFNGDSKILVVNHDIDDGGWQFLDGDEMTMADAILVCMKNVIDLDNTVVEVANMEPGYVASRNFVGDKWVIEKSIPLNDDVV